ncbi:MAG: arsenate reductase ArsC [Betaproteobacteria bacterium]
MKTYNILFLCTGNSCRSIIGEALASTISHGRLIGYSAGSKPKSDIHPLAMELAERLGYSSEKLRNKSWEEFASPNAPQMDFIITVCDDAAGESCPVWPGHPATAHWGFPDPAAVVGSEEQIRNAFEQVEIGIRNRIEFFLELPLETLDSISIKHHLAEIHKNA